MQAATRNSDHHIFVARRQKRFNEIHNAIGLSLTTGRETVTREESVS